MKTPVANNRISEEEMEIQRKRTQLQEVERKSFFKTSAIVKKSNKEQIERLRKENVSAKVIPNSLTNQPLGSIRCSFWPTNF